jgi:hypothetical protein
VLCKVLTFLSKTSAYMACIRDMYNERWTQDLFRHPVLCIWSWSTLLGLNKIHFLLYEQLFIYMTISLSSKSSDRNWSVIFRYKSIRNVWHTGEDKSKYYYHIVLLYLESRRCRYRSIMFACFYLYITVVIFIDYSDIDNMMDINNEKC